uniref:Uncharacterized protein n=1 Tax=Caenorhabditis japonica TaxID=281687 RepID=A0A8R1E225_CAEJA
MKRPFRCPIITTAAVVGVSAIAIALYYYFANRKKDEKCEKKESCKDSPAPAAAAAASSSSTLTVASTASEVPPSEVPSEPRKDGGKDLTVVEEYDDNDMFKFPDENVRKVCNKLFQEQMDLGEALMADEETAERGAMHLANAIALTGETEPLLKVLRKVVSPANFACIQKYIPTAEMRVNQLLQDELTIETIAENFGAN